jgi:hypothetical protein
MVGSVDWLRRSIDGRDDRAAAPLPTTISKQAHTHTPPNPTPPTPPDPQSTPARTHARTLKVSRFSSSFFCRFSSTASSVSGAPARVVPRLLPRPCLLSPSLAPDATVAPDSAPDVAADTSLMPLALARRRAAPCAPCAPVPVVLRDATGERRAAVQGVVAREAGGGGGVRGESQLRLELGEDLVEGVEAAIQRHFACLPRPSRPVP